jgi:hypothetical protein
LVPLGDSEVKTDMPSVVLRAGIPLKLSEVWDVVEWSLKRPYLCAVPGVWVDSDTMHQLANVLEQRSDAMTLVLAPAFAGVRCSGARKEMLALRLSASSDVFEQVIVPVLDDQRRHWSVLHVAMHTQATEAWDSCQREGVTVHERALVQDILDILAEPHAATPRPTFRVSTSCPKQGSQNMNECGPIAAFVCTRLALRDRVVIPDGVRTLPFAKAIVRPLMVHAIASAKSAQLLALKLL